MLPVFHGCVEEVELVEELNLPACLTPSSTSMSVDRATGNKVTYTWANSKGATRYVVEIFEGAEEDLRSFFPPPDAGGMGQGSG